jgi:signal transduction histidine kinase
LLAMIDNLIDLSDLKERGLRQQPVDLAAIAREAAASADAIARERQVTVAPPAESEAGNTSVIGDSWAIRRILDNLLANSVRITPPGGSVSVSVSRDESMVTVSVSDTGRGLLPELTQEFHEDASPPDGSPLLDTGATGLTLSSRLAQTMNGRVTARNQPEAGAIVSLSLPVA